MRKKRLVAIVLAAGLLFGSAIPVLAVGGDAGNLIEVSRSADSGETAAIPPPSEEAEQSNSEAVAPASPSDAEQGTSPEAQPAALEQDDDANTIPPQPAADSAPAFSAKLIFDADGYGVLGTVDFLPAGAKSILPMLSLDNMDYEELPDFSWAVGGGASQICLRGGESFERYLCGLEDALWLKLRVTLSDNTQYETAPAEVVRERVPPPDKPPAFVTEIVSATGQGAFLFGKFTAFTPGMKTLQPVYSLDGDVYQPILEQDGSALFWDLTLPVQSTGMNSLTRQPCAMPHMEPFARYLKGDLDKFFVKLRITDWSGNSYDTQPSLVRREDGGMLPEKFTAMAGWPAFMRGRDSTRPPTPYYGKVFVTAREGMTVGELETLLPATLPIEIQLMKPDQDGVPVLADSVVLFYPVEWTLPQDLTLIAGEPLVLRNAITAPVISAGQEVALSGGVYTLAEGAPFDTRYMSTELRLFITVLPETAGPDLRLSDQLEVGDGPLALWLALGQKPSGATAIRYFYYMEGMADWVEAGELLTQTPVDTKPGSPASEYYTLFTPEQSPYQQFLSGERQGFLVGIEIEGGVFDGALSTAKWPKKYELPTRIPDFNGSGGNENNVGDGDTSGGDSSGDGGQRPGLPGEDDSPTPPPTGGQDPEPSPEPSPRPDPEPLPTPPLSEQHVAPALAVIPQPGPAQPKASAPQSPPQAEGDSKQESPQESRAAPPSIAPDPSAAPEASPQPAEEVVRTPGESKKFPPVAAASVVVCGVAATVAIGTAVGVGSTAASGGIVSRVFSALKRFFSK